MNITDTICAISTPAGSGAIAIIRISGKDAFTVSEKLFKPASGKNISFRQSETNLIYGSFYDKDETIDEVLLTIFRTPHSYTGDDIIEISCHGSVYIQQRILQLLIENNVRLAEPGEFTQRAFLNGKMDLSQAEGVADLIASSSKSAHRMAINQMRGGFSNEIKKLREQLLNFISLIELELDFSEEDVEFADRKQLIELVYGIEIVIGSLKDSFQLGNAIKNGVPVTIAGETNVGKSTLLNALLEDDKAIVSDIAGTTRDAIEDVIIINGISFRFIDTAGLRVTTDQIETMGIERTYQKIKQAQIILFLLDLNEDIDHNVDLLNALRKRTDEQHIIITGNKADTAGNVKINEMVARVRLSDNEDIVFISAKDGHNISQIKSLLLETVAISQPGTNDVIVANTRHYEALTHAYEAIERVIDGLNNSISNDFLAQDIRECMHYLGEITGDISTDEILGNIFEKFCIGK